MVPAPPPVQDIDGAIDDMWASSADDIARIDAAAENWKTQLLPLARIKKIMKSEEAVYAEMERDRQEQQARADGSTADVGGPNTRFMIAGEAPVLLGKACELLVKELTVRAWRHTERNRRRTLQRQDVHAAVGESEVYDFLIDIVPRIATTTTSAQKPFGAPGNGAPEAPAGGALPSFVNGPPARGAPAPPSGQSGDNNVMSLSDAEAGFAHMQQAQGQMRDHFMLMQQQQQPRIQGDSAAASSTTQSNNAPAPSAGAPQAANHAVQPQSVMLGSTFAVQGSDPNAAGISLGQWSLPAPSNGNAQPPAPAPPGI